MRLYHVINGHSSNTIREQNQQLPHDFAGKGVLNVLSGVPPKWFLPFQSYDSVALTPGCKLASFYHLLYYSWYIFCTVVNLAVAYLLKS